MHAPMCLFDYFDMLNMTIAELKRREYVGAEVLRTMERFRGEEIEKNAQHIIQRLDDAWMRDRAIDAFCQLEPHVLAKYAQHITPMLDDRWMRGKAIEVLGKLEPQVLAEYTQDIIPRLEDENWCVRWKTTLVLEKLEPQVLAKYAQHIIPRLEDEDWNVRYEATKAFGSLEPQVLAKYAQHIIPRLEEEDWRLRIKAIEAFGSLEPQVLARYTQNIIPRLDDDAQFVCDRALETLMTLPLPALVPHRYPLKCCKCRRSDLKSLRGRVWLVRWRQLFWGKRLLRYWGNRACKSGSRQARAAARESGQMQGGLAEGDVEREVKRARGA